MRAKITDVDTLITWLFEMSTGVMEWYDFYLCLVVGSSTLNPKMLCKSLEPTFISFFFLGKWELIAIKSIIM